MTIILPTRYSGYVSLLLGVWLAAWGMVEVFLVVNLVSVLENAPANPARSAGVIVALLASFTVAGAYLFWRLLWVLKGREILSITRSRLILQRMPKTGAAVEYDRSQIQELHVGTYDAGRIYPSWGRRFVGKGSAFIGFRYQGKACQIARGIRHRDARDVLGHLRG